MKGATIMAVSAPAAEVARDVLETIQAGGRVDDTCMGGACDGTFINVELHGEGQDAYLILPDPASMQPPTRDQMRRLLKRLADEVYHGV